MCSCWERNLPDQQHRARSRCDGISMHAGHYTITKHTMNYNRCCCRRQIEPLDLATKPQTVQRTPCHKADITLLALLPASLTANHA
jgi:hypothetical protein